MYNKEKVAHDGLRGRFTVWLENLLRNAKVDYVRKLSRRIDTVSIDDVPESSFMDDRNSFSLVETEKSGFDFEEERLADAFAKLPLMRQQILTMLFVEDKRPDEIAAQLNCSIQHVYNQRSLALGKLRKELGNGGDGK